MRNVLSVLAAIGCVSAFLFLLPAAPVADAQSGARAPEQKPAPFEARFWNWLSQANYREWAAPAGESADEFYPGKSPHGALIKTHLNRTAAAHSKELPPGSVVVKENFDKDKKLLAVSVMHKSKGYDPEHQDWWYGQYLPDGTVATMKTKDSDKPMMLVGNVNACIECHQGAAGDDYVFFND